MTGELGLHSMGFDNLRMRPKTVCLHDIALLQLPSLMHAHRFALPVLSTSNIICFLHQKVFHEVAP